MGLLIAISKKWCTNWDRYPAYFAYLLGHEFGHAHICISDISLHIHCCLVHDWIKRTSRNEIKYQHSLPNELLFDQYGKFISIKMYGNRKLNSDINNIQKEPNGSKDFKRLEIIKRIPPISEINGLRDSLIEFSLPYKDELIKCWKMDFRRNGQKSLASYISNYNKLFEKENIN